MSVPTQHGSGLYAAIELALMGRHRPRWRYCFPDGDVRACYWTYRHQYPCHHERQELCSNEVATVV